MDTIQRPLVFVGKKNIRKVVLSILMRMILQGPKNAEQSPRPAKILSFKSKNDFSRSTGGDFLISISLVTKLRLRGSSGLGRTNNQAVILDCLNT